MKYFRKSLAVLLSLLMLFGLCAVSSTAPLTVSAAQDETIIIVGSDYQTADGTLYIDAIG